MILLVAFGCAACNAPRGEESAADGGCRLRIIATFDRPPDSALLEDLARVSRARLQLLREMPADLYLMELAADEPADAACSRALERLRRDERVRSADIDERRGIAE
jgi:hypothetical protein